MTPNQYIITDPEHNRLWILLPKFGLEERRGEYATVSIDSIIEINDILQKIGSRLYDPQVEYQKAFDEGFEIGKAQCETHHEEIKYAEREKALSQLSQHDAFDILEERILSIDEIKERINYWVREGESLNEDSCGKIEYYKRLLRSTKGGEQG